MADMAKGWRGEARGYYLLNGREFERKYYVRIKI